jgi:threonyl-tRNA synthetase
MLVLGEQEQQAGTVAVRKRGEGDAGTWAIREFTDRLLREITSKL